MLDWWPTGVDRDTTLALLPGDVVAVLLFVAMGEVRHHLPPWEFPVRYVLVALPFVAGWLVVAPLAGAYARRARASVPVAVVVTLVAWFVAAAVAMGLRATEPLPGDADRVFYLVAAAFGGALLAVWRAVRTRV
jgi:hypothetical protein